MAQPWVYSKNGIDLPVTPETGEAVDGIVAWELGVLDDGRIIIAITEDDEGLHGYCSHRALSPASARTLGRELVRLSSKLLGEVP